jgi:hypothetical protein
MRRSSPLPSRGSGTWFAKRLNFSVISAQVSQEEYSVSGWLQLRAHGFYYDLFLQNSFGCMLPFYATFGRGLRLSMQGRDSTASPYFHRIHF